MMDIIEESDLHYLTTLRKYEERAGKYVELDRKGVFYDNRTNSFWINAYDEQIIELSQISNVKSPRLSIKGKFINIRTSPVF